MNWDPNDPQIDLCFAMDATGSMGSHIAHCKNEVANSLRSLTTSCDMPVTCSFVSHKDFGNQGHLKVFVWAHADDDSQMGQFRDFIVRLQPSGGKDLEEDAAGSLEKALLLMEQRRDVRSVKSLASICDAGGHGFPRGRPNHCGVDQKKRLEAVVKKLTASSELGCEMLLARITPHADPMCQTIDEWLQSERTFVDQIDVGSSGATIFCDKVLASLNQVVSQAIAPPSSKGVDVHGGADFSVVGNMLICRLANCAARLLDAFDEQANAEAEIIDEEVKEAAEDEEEAVDSVAEEEKGKPAEKDNKEALTTTNAVFKDVKMNDVEETEEDGAKTSLKEMPTAFENLVGKLESDDCNIVRVAMGALKDGTCAEHEAPPSHELSHAGAESLLQAGMMVHDLCVGGHPEHAISVFEEVLKDQLAKGAAKRC